MEMLSGNIFSRLEFTFPSQETFKWFSEKPSMDTKTPCPIYKNPLNYCFQVEINIFRRWEFLSHPGIFLIIDTIWSENHGWEWELTKTQDQTMVGNKKFFPVQRIAMDILGPLPETEQGNKYILVIGGRRHTHCQIWKP